MKRFQFSLATVLDYKQQVQEELQNEHTILLQRVHAQEELLQRLEEKYQACNREFRAAEREGITVAQALSYESDLRYWQREIEKGQKLLAQYEKEAEEKRSQVVAARQDTSSLEKLRDQKREDYRKKTEKSQEVFIEELVNAKRIMAMETM
ncbi:MAG: flagellar FliJ family protein [Lawsonibacter sp.]|jgi:flagellar FliJ protein